MYDEETITIDIDRLRSDMHDECIWGFTSVENLELR